MADELDPIIDINGEERRCGSLVVPEGFVSAFADYDSVLVPYDDDKIRRLITDPNRVPSRVTFNETWTQNQQSKGSCNGYLQAQLMGKMRWLRGIQDKALFSGAFAYSLINDGRDYGSVLEHGMVELCEQGICLESLVPWNMIYSNQQPPNAKAEAAKHKGLNPFRIANLQQLRTALAMQEPVGIALQAGKNWQKLNVKGIGGVDSGNGNHAVVADDLVLIDGHEYMDVHNQWGNQFGINGRVYLPFDSIAQTMKYHVFYKLGSTVEA